MSEKNPLFYIITLNHNNYSYTEECLKSLRNLTYDNFKILVVDDKSSDNQIDNLKIDFQEVELIRNKTNLHYCKSFNVGIRYALENKADYIFLVNNDTKDFSRNYLEIILQNFETDDKIGMVGSKCIDFQGGIRRDENASNRFGILMDTPTEGYVIKSSVFRKIGLLNEFLIIYMEDLDFINRMRLAGYKTKIDTSISFSHLGGVTTSKRPYKSTYLRVRNISLFARKMGKNKNRIWVLNEVRGNIKSHFKQIFISIGNLQFIKAFSIASGVTRGLFAGFTLDLEEVWDPDNYKIKP